METAKAKKNNPAVKISTEIGFESILKMESKKYFIKEFGRFTSPNFSLTAHCQSVKGQ